MKIAISAEGMDLNAAVDPRFGRAQTFIFFDTEDGSFEAFPNEQVRNLPQGAGIQAAQQVSEHKAQVLLTGHCGPNAFRGLAAAKIEVYVGVSGTVQEAIDKYQSGSLQASGTADVEGHW